jgi:membrane protease YdiL (CAAX protease family)
MNTNPSQETLSLKYFLLVFVLSVPFWAIGGNQLPLPMDLPVSALMFVTPLIAASILVYQQAGFKGVKELLKKALDAHKTKNKLWYLPALLLTPLIYFLSFVIMRLTGMPLPDPIQIPWLLAPIFFAAYFVSATCEELGWMGYAVDPLQKRWGALSDEASAPPKERF